MKYNLIFNFDNAEKSWKEVGGEDSIGTIKRFIGEVMRVPNSGGLYIPVAHRLKGSSGKTKPILAKFPNANELDLVLKHTNRLKAVLSVYKEDMLDNKELT